MVNVPEPFDINTSDELLYMTPAKLESAKFPHELSDMGWQDGTPVGLSELPVQPLQRTSRGKEDQCGNVTI